MILTKKLLFSLRNQYQKGFTIKQLELLGLPYPPPRGWVQTVVGREISTDMLVQLQDAGAGLWLRVCCDTTMERKIGKFGVFWKCNTCGKTKKHDATDV